jgi:hypothetical protein
MLAVAYAHASESAHTLLQSTEGASMSQYWQCIMLPVNVQLRPCSGKGLHGEETQHLTAVKAFRTY